MPEFKSWRDYWVFEHSTKNKARYVRSTEAEAFLDAIRQTMDKRVKVIGKDQGLWRAQIGYDIVEIIQADEHIVDEPVPYSAVRMKPISGRANEGRVNPKGIPYLYLATNRETALAEVRPWIGSSISIGLFKTLRELRIVNCTTDQKGNLIYLSEPSAEKREESVWRGIDRAFARPVSPSDDVADYVPTQIITELFKANNFDGVAYRSSLGDGYNVALFDLDTADLVSCFLFDVESVEFKFKESANPYTVRKPSNIDTT